MATTEPALQTTALRERLGRRVREVWIAWAQQQPSPKPSWLVPWDDLGEADKEVDCCIGSAIWADCIAEHVGSIASAELARLTTDSVQEEPTLKEASVEAEIKRLAEHNRDLCTEVLRLQAEMSAPVGMFGTTDDYKNAPSGIGPKSDEWKDKPHRLVYDVCSEIEKLQAIVDKPPTGDEVFEILITYVSQLIRDEKEK